MQLDILFNTWPLGHVQYVDKIQVREVLVTALFEITADFVSDIAHDFPDGGLVALHGYLPVHARRRLFLGYVIDVNLDIEPSAVGVHHPWGLVAGILNKQAVLKRCEHGFPGR